MKKPLLLLLLFTFLLNSCAGSESDEGRDVVTFVKLSASENLVLLGNSVKFNLVDNLNNDVTDKATFYINGKINESGPVFKTEHLGEYNITATYEKFTIKPLKLSVIKPEGTIYTHRILYEDFTGTWCGNCPIAGERFNRLIAQNDKAVIVGIHGPTVQADPYTNEASMAIISDLKVTAYPTILLNHTKNWSTANFSLDVAFGLAEIKPYSRVGIGITTKLDGNTLSGEYKVAFAQNYDNLKLIVYIVEDKIVYPQHNYFNGSGGKPILYGGVPIIPNYENHNVLRALLTPAKGENIPSTNTQNNTEYLKNFSYTIPANFNKENVKIIVAVLNGQNEVLNVREALPNTTNVLEAL